MISSCRLTPPYSFDTILFGMFSCLTAEERMIAAMCPPPPPKKKKTRKSRFLGLCSDWHLSFFTLLDRTSFPHYNNTKIIKFGWKLFILLSNFFMDCHFRDLSLILLLVGGPKNGTVDFLGLIPPYSFDTIFVRNVFMPDCRGKNDSGHVPPPPPPPPQTKKTEQSIF